MFGTIIMFYICVDTFFASKISPTEPKNKSKIVPIKFIGTILILAMTTYFGQYAAYLFLILAAFMIFLRANKTSNVLMKIMLWILATMIIVLIVINFYKIVYLGF
ncbi:MAG: hypothetical protein Q7S57_00225 [bacterium]|nr:hypothetical protein [bacterium]